METSFRQDSYIKTPTSELLVSNCCLFSMTRLLLSIFARCHNTSKVVVRETSVSIAIIVLILPSFPSYILFIYVGRGCPHGNYDTNFARCYNTVKQSLRLYTVQFGNNWANEKKNVYVDNIGLTVNCIINCFDL